MRTLDIWVERLTKTPCTIECPEMQVLGYDHEPPLFTGSGHVLIRSPTSIEFVMHARPRDGDEAFRRYLRSKENPHSGRDQFRILGTEYDGTEWNCGWTDLCMGGEVNGVWRLSGPLLSLMTGDSGNFVSKIRGVELVYDRRLRLPTPINMFTSVKLDDEEIQSSRRRGRKVLEVAGSKIEFLHSIEGDFVWATATTSSDFGHPYAENWISEPLTLLFGQLVFPRLVARNMGDGTATISLRSSPAHTANPLAASILGEDPQANEARFWGLYRDILTMVAYARDTKGQPNFETHPLTLFYHEVVQATEGSHWVQCMTLASVCEGIAKMLAEPGELKSDHAADALKDLGDYLAKWRGDEKLRARIQGAVSRAGDKGIGGFLSHLAKQGDIEKPQVESWMSVRNRVMHGELVSPWLDEESETKLVLLTGLAHRLGLLYIKKAVSQVDGYRPFTA